MKRSVSGAFKATVAAAVKFGLLESKRGQLTTTELFSDYKLAYSEDDKQASLQKAFLTPAVYKKLFARFNGKQLPIAILDKLLAREFDVSENDANRVSRYFIEGARSLDLLRGDDVLDSRFGHDKPSHENDEPDQTDRGIDFDRIEEPDFVAAEYTVRLNGPGMKSEIRLLEVDDLLIVDAMLAKVRKKLETESFDAREEQNELPRKRNVPR